MSRADASSAELAKLPPFYFYVDEFQNFANDSFASILSEARKYRLNLTIAHQFIGQLEDDIKNAVFGNVGSLVSFRIGADDAEYLVKQFEPDYSVKDLINTENLHAVLRVLIDGQPSKPFTIKLRPPERGSLERAQALAELSSLTYGKDVSTVEEDILSRLRA
jgi:DNA helicase HerA-like ATPase